MDVFLVAMTLSAGFALLVGWKANGLGNSLSLVDHPDPAGGRKRHDRATPLVGGIGALVPVFAVLILLVQFDPLLAAAEQSSLIWITLASGAMFVVGLIDDRFELAARARLVIAVGTLAFALIMAPELSLSFVRFSFSDAALIPAMPVAIGFTMLCMIGFTNAVNMADGKNGVVIGMCLIWTGLLWQFAPTTVKPVILALAAGLVVMLAFNWKSRLFLGDSGSYGLATLIGLLVIYIYKRRFVDLPADVICVWFAVPVLDCLRLLAKRALRGQSPFAGDRDHLHHHLGVASRNWAVGWSIYMALVGVPSVIATVWPHTALACGALVTLCYMALIMAMSRRFSVAGTA